MQDQAMGARKPRWWVPVEPTLARRGIGALLPRAVHPQGSDLLRTRTRRIWLICVSPPSQADQQPSAPNRQLSHMRGRGEATKLRGTHVGHWCQEGIGVWPGDVRGVAWLVRLFPGSSSQLRGHAVVRKASSWSTRSRAAARTNELDPPCPVPGRPGQRRAGGRRGSLACGRGRTRRAPSGQAAVELPLWTVNERCGLSRVRPPACTGYGPGRRTRLGFCPREPRLAQPPLRSSPRYGAAARPGCSERKHERLGNGSFARNPRPCTARVWPRLHRSGSPPGSPACSPEDDTAVAGAAAAADEPAPHSGSNPACKRSTRPYW